MFDHPRISKKEKRLKKIMDKYEKLTGKDPVKFRALIPPQEIWRFFIEAKVQTNGRGLQQEDIFYEGSSLGFFNTHLQKPIKQVVLKTEKNLKDWHDGSIIKKLNEKYWLLTDEQLEKFSLQKLFDLDKAWIPFELNQKGYLKALYAAFQLAMDDTQTMGDEFVKKLHQQAIEKVENTNYAKKDSSRLGNFREEKIYYRLSKINSTVAGIQQILENNHADQFICIQLETNPEVFFQINHSLLEKLRNNANQKINFSDFTFYTSGARISPEDVPDINKEIEKFCNEFSVLDKEAAQLITHYKNNTEAEVRFFSKQIDFKKAIPKRFDDILQTYQQALTVSKNEMAKLSAIIKFVQDCEQLHPFLDANCRTFCMLTLLHEMRIHGFPLAMIADPNCFDGFSIAEIVDEVLKGMENTFELIEKKKLFNVSTQAVMDFLMKNNKTASDFYAESLRYFKEVIEIEAQARMAVKESARLT